MLPMRPVSGPEPLLTVAEVAAILGRTPQAVRDLIAAGTLPAQRIGRAFVVTRTEVERLQRLPRPVGRPWTPAVAWELITLLQAAGRNTPTPAVPPARRRQVCERTVGELAARLQVRAWRAPVGVTSGRWRRLLDDALVVPSGDRLTATVDAYVTAGDLPAVQQRYGLEVTDGVGGAAARGGDPAVWPAAAHPTEAAGVLRVVPAGVPASLRPRRPRAGPVVAALDAIEDPDAERHEAGLTALAGLQQRVCAHLAPSE